MCPTHPDLSEEEPSVRWLTEVRLERFKAAFKPKPIVLQPFNVIIGRNGSGKSTLIEALQWIDTAIRRDAREASDPYAGVGSLVNLRSQAKTPYFGLTLQWDSTGSAPAVTYKLKVEERESRPLVAEESLASQRKSGTAEQFITTGLPGERLIASKSSQGRRVSIPFREPDRLALPTATGPGTFGESSAVGFLHAFWERAVFLRLSPNRLADGSPATRKSFEPLLDEEGKNLPALLSELDREQTQELASHLEQVLSGIKDVWVSEPRGREVQIHFGLWEEMPYQGRSGKSKFPIPAWMLSEGTRRITAILALLVRNPPPTLLCIEEIENGLDPWTVIEMLGHLRSAVARGVQVIVTTHSPWLLNSVPLESILHVSRVKGDTRYEHFASLEAVKAYSESVPPGVRYVSEAE